MNPSDTLILIAGATGARGDGMTRARLAAGFRVGILMRKPEAPAAT